MIRRFFLAPLVGLSVALAGCGGGGGSGGSSLYGDGSNDSGTVEEGSYAVTVTVERNGSSINSMTSTQTAQAVAKVVDSSNNGIEGVVVTFTESDASLIKFAPTSATALTDSSGVATIDVAAQSTDAAGATTVTATATVAETAYTGSSSISISAGSTSDVVEPKAINFVSVAPSDSAIVIKGSGGNGRSESATLTFKVVDESGAPVKGAVVDFSLSPEPTAGNEASPSLNISTATSDADGVVTTTVQSGTQPTSVIVVATSDTDSTVSGRSDTLLVSNDVAFETGFEIVAETYNLDGRTTGETTTVSAFVRDQFGNPVADGTAVSFTTDFGNVASSTAGGCVTSDGTCSVTFRVQDPRGGGLATVIGELGGTAVQSQSININMAGATGGSYVATADGSRSALTFGGCKQTFEFSLEDSDTGRSVAAETAISVASTSSDVTATVKSGTPVLDSTSFAPLGFTVEVDLTGADLAPDCVPGGTLNQSGFVTLQYATSNGVTFTQRFALIYPQ